MTVKECYEALHGNYEDAKSRLMSDRLIEKFMLKFPQDETMQKLKDALTAGDYEAAFLSAHTMKGVAANLGFSALQEAASVLTECLRADRSAPEASMVQKVCDEYDRVLDAIRKYQNA